LLFIFLIGCDTSRVYELNIDLEDNFWKQDHMPTFQIEIPDADQSYNVYYNIRNTISYPYYNLYLKHILEDSISNVISTNLDELILFDEKTGRPLGSGLGDIFEHQIPVLVNYQFSNKGKYTLKVQQFMRLDSLPHIMSVGIRVEKAR